MEAYPNAPYAPLLPGEEAPLAHPLKRLGARMLDGFLGALSLMPGMFLMFSGEDSPLFVLGLLLMIGGFLAFVVYQVVLLAREGQTVAKRALHLRVVDYDDEGNPGLARVFLVRELAVGAISAVPVLGALFALANALFIFGEEHRCIHDHLARTKVVDETEVAVRASEALI